MNKEHEHEFLWTFLRKIGDKEFVMYAGEKSTDRYVLMCDCGEIKEEKENPINSRNKGLDL